jgi:hypothetical protein
MPRGDGQARKRRGRYDEKASVPPSIIRPAVLEATTDDLAWLERLIVASPLEDVDTKRALAEHALTQRLALRDLRSGRQLVVDEQKAIASIGYELRKALLDLKLTERVKESEDDL